MMLKERKQGLLGEPSRLRARLRVGVGGRSFCWRCGRESGWLGVHVIGSGGREVRIFAYICSSSSSSSTPLRGTVTLALSCSLGVPSATSRWRGGGGAVGGWGWLAIGCWRLLFLVCLLVVLLLLELILLFSFPPHLLVDLLHRPQLFLQLHASVLEPYFHLKERSNVRQKLRLRAVLPTRVEQQSCHVGVEIFFNNRYIDNNWSHLFLWNNFN